MSSFPKKFRHPFFLTVLHILRRQCVLTIFRIMPMHLREKKKKKERKKEKEKKSCSSSRTNAYYTVSWNHTFKSTQTLCFCENCSTDGGFDLLFPEFLVFVFKIGSLKKTTTEGTPPPQQAHPYWKNCFINQYCFINQQQNDTRPSKKIPEPV